MLGTDGWLALLFVAHRGDVAIVQLLLEAGANVPPTDSGTQSIHPSTVLHIKEAWRLSLSCLAPAPQT